MAVGIPQLYFSQKQLSSTWNEFDWPWLILELVVRLAHKYDLGEKNICCLFTHSCVLQLLFHVVITNVKILNSF